MFALRIHTVSQPPFAKQFGSGAATSGTKSAVAGGSNPKSKKNLFSPTELKGVVHLFRNLPTISSSPAMTLFNVTTRTTLAFIVAVPNYLSPEEFITFCGSHVEYFTDLCFIRYDAVEERYSVLIKLVNQAAADGFCCRYNGKRFGRSETEVCHVYFAQLVEYTDSAEISSIPHPGYTELPTCPVCLERLDHDTSAIKITVCDHSFQCSCITKWPFWSCQVCRLCQQQDGKPTCAVCGTSSNLWVCLICSFVGCGRYEQRHAIKHFRHAQHSYSLKLETKQIWDYVGDKYVHRLNQSKIGSKSIATNHQCESLEGECGDKEDDEVDRALFSTKVDAVTLRDVVDGMKVEFVALKRKMEEMNEDLEEMKIKVVNLLALKTELEKVKEDMEQMKKEKYVDAMEMKENLYKFSVGFLILIIVYLMK